MGERIRLVPRRIRYNLRGGFLVRPLIITLTLGDLGAFLSFLEEMVPGFSDFVPKLLFPSHADPQDLRDKKRARCSKIPAAGAREGTQLRRMTLRQSIEKPALPNGAPPSRVSSPSWSNVKILNSSRS
jgi:hypothetical protein